MAWMKIYNEKIKPYILLVGAGILVYLMVGNIMGANRIDDIIGTIDGIHGDLSTANELVGDVLSDFSDIKKGIGELETTVADLDRIEQDLIDTSERLERAILNLGDESTESGILADRLYRISRELAKRSEKTKE